MASRPHLPRNDTNDILSYYSSPHAGRQSPPRSRAPTPPPPERQPEYPRSVLSSPSDYSSDYSDDDDDDDGERASTSAHTHTTSPSPQEAQYGHRRRPSSPSRGAADKRRMAIVEMDMNAPHVRHHPSLRRKPSAKHDEDDPFTSAGPSSSSPRLASRRGHTLAGLALVAPPDFSPTRYLDMEPPMSAPVPVHHERAPTELEPSVSASSSSSAHGHSHQHHRAQSEAVVAAERTRSIRRKRSRDVGIVGASPEALASVATDPSAGPHSGSARSIADRGGAGGGSSGLPLIHALAPPVFQTPHSRASSPGSAMHSNASSTSLSSFGTPYLNTGPVAGGLVAADMEATPTKRRAYAGPLTPDIGEGKAVGEPVAGPVVVGLGAQEPWLTPSLSRGSSQGLINANVSGASSSASISQYSSATSCAASPSPASASPAHSPHPSSYLNYQPGVHATAGPLPPPPRAIFELAASTPPPPRPPRLHSPPPPTASPRRIEQELDKQAPSTSSAQLTVARAPPLQRAYSDFSITALSDSSDGEGVQSRLAHPSLRASPLTDEGKRPPGQPARELSGGSQRSGHVREGAFPPSTIYSDDQSTSSVAQSSDHASNEGSSVAPIPIPSSRAGGEGEDTPVTVTRQKSRSSLSSRSSARSKSSWVSLRPQETLSADGHYGRYDDDEEEDGITRRLTRVKSYSPVRTGPATDDGHGNGGASRSFKNTLANFNFKRFSALPRTPSLGGMSKQSRSSRGSGSRMDPSPSRTALEPSPNRAFLELSPSPSLGGRPSPSPGASPRPTPSPELPPPPRNPARVRPATLPAQARPKIKSKWPEPMQYSDVLSRKTALDRSMGYAQKLNELSKYEVGLGDWIMAMKTRGSNPRVPTAAPSTHPEQQFNGQTRHVSGASVESEATFPVRPDASLATDLTPRPHDDAASATSAPPILPYPSLVSIPGVRGTSTLASMASPPSSMRGIPISLPISATMSAPAKASGFFASLGRRNSVTREKKSPGLASRVLSKNPPVPPQPRPVQMISAPVVRGGPRAPPGRVKRSQTEGPALDSAKPLVISPPIMTAVSLPAPEPVVASPTAPEPQPRSVARSGTVVGGPRALGSRARTSQQSPPVESPWSFDVSSPPASTAGSAKRRSSVLRRPSVWGRSEAKPSSPTAGEAASDPEFTRQVTKLSEVLPHADKDILAGYLRRAGQDVVAIGQYLEDERNGRLRRD